MTEEKKCYEVHSYSPDCLKNALEDISDGNSIRATAKKYNIPKSTLHSKCTDKTPVECRKGPKTNLTAEEEIRIEKWILHKAKLGFPMHSDEVRKAVQNVLQEAPRPNTFIDNKPGKKWLDLFLKRHPKLTIKKPEAISKGRACVTEENLRNWSLGVEIHLKEMGWIDILKKPGSIFNGDEIGMQLCPDIGGLLGEKGEKDFYTISSGKEKETITVLCTFSAAGDFLPPMIMFPYKRIPCHLSESVPDDWPIGRSDSGWMVSSTFYEYIANIFYPWCVKTKVEFPVIYFLDGHKSHLTLELSDFCIKHDIILYSLYPNSTHITQPCDVAIFRALKNKWKEVIRQHKQKTQKNVTKAVFAPLFKEAFDQIDKEAIINGFRVCGLYPFDANAVNYDKCISKRRKDIKNEETNNGCESAQFITTNDLLSTQKFFNHVLGEEKINEFKRMKHQSALCNDPVYELWKKCVDELNAVPLVNDITNVIKTENENELHNTDLNVISTVDLPVIAVPEDPTYVESIENIPSLQDISHDETDFMSYDCTDDFKSSFDDGIVNDPVDNIAGCDNLDKFLKETDTEKSNLITNETINNGKVNNEEELIAEVHSAQDLNDNDNNFISDNLRKSCEGTAAASKTNKTIKEIWDKHLTWPEVGEINKKRKKEKDQLPFAITAPKWREYHKKLREEKEKKTLEAEKKALKRKIKKEEDEMKKQENKKIREMKKIERERKKEEKLKEKEEKAERKRKLQEENLKAKKNRPVKKKNQHKIFS